MTIPGIGVSMSEAEYNESIVLAYETGKANDLFKAANAAAGNPELEARIEAANRQREASTLLTIARARTHGLGWSGNAADVADLCRILQRAGVWP